MLELRDIAFSYNRGTRLQTAALVGVSLCARPGTLTLVVGATGSGKSTLLRVASGLLRPDSGTATVDGVPVGDEAVRGRVGIAFQEAEYQLFADTVLDDVRFGPLNLGRSNEDATSCALEAMLAVGLEPEQFARRSPFSLSGGEARRAAIAGVLAMRPDHLVLDEPTAGLDKAGTAAVLAAIAAVRHSTAIVVVTHEIEDFLAVADQVLVLESGSCAWSGPAAELIGMPHVLTDAGLEPPDMLSAQALVVERFGEEFPFTMDVAEAARSIAGLVKRA